MNIFVGNLSFETRESDLTSLFEGFGVVASAVIVMRKEEKVPKSRGFGFVDMPDAVQAMAAITALDGKEFMGRIIDVEPERPKAETPRKIELEEKVQPVLNEHLALKDGQVRPSGQPGTYRGGRRTNSYIKKRQLAGLSVEVKPRKNSHDNPMRWRKNKDQARPWLKNKGENKPWHNPEGEARPARPWTKPAGDTRPWKKPAGDAKPWKKAEGESRPWKKPAGDAKPWAKPAGEFRIRRKSYGLKPWEKPEGAARPWKKPEGAARSWKKPAGDAKPWSKSSGRAQKPGVNPSTSLGMVRGNGERSRTRRNKKPGGYKR